MKQNHQLDTQEASLVQTLEKEGIGRPSTYAPIIATIQKRGYAFKDKNALIPTITGIIVTNFLKKCFPDYVNTQFTSTMEQILDEIALGKKEHIKYLKNIYCGKNGLKQQIETQEKKKNEQQSRSMQLKGLEGFTFFSGPYGAYVVKESKKKKDVVSASIPPNVYPADLTKEDLSSFIQAKIKGSDSLGKDPQSGQLIYALTGRFGPYVQRGNKDDKDVKRVTIPKGLSVSDVDLKMALKLLELPKKIGTHPKTEKDIKKGIGRFGPYIVHDGDFRSIRDLDIFLDLTLKQSVDILNEPKKKRGQKLLKNLGSHPKTGKSIQLLNGKYGPYVQYQSEKVSLPSHNHPSSFTLKQALTLLNTSKSATKQGHKAKKVSILSAKQKKIKKSYKTESKNVV